MDNIQKMIINPSYFDLGLILAKSTLSKSEYMDLFKKSVGNYLTDYMEDQYHALLLYKEIDNLNAENLFFEEIQEQVCVFCEDNILHCSRSSVLFQCEGCSCAEAREMYLEELEDYK